MSQQTGIEWTDATWNPIRGCTRVSDGCRHCYAETVAARFSGPGQPYEGLATRGPARWTGKVRIVEKHLTDPLRWRKPQRVFVNSMSDLFHESVPDEWIDRIFAVMALAPHITFQVLTKRPERMGAYLRDAGTPFRVARAMDAFTGSPRAPERIRPIVGFPGYFVSSHGAVLSKRRGKQRRMRPDYGEQGHARVQLHRAGAGRRGERMLVHRLVLMAFVGPPPAADSQGRHIDGDARNNAVENLAWGDQSANWDDAKRHGSHRRYSKLAPEEVGWIRQRAALGESCESLARAFGVSATQIRNIVEGRQWSTADPIDWPLPGVWLGVSVEDQATADARIPLLLQTPAAVRFVSAEPLLGPVDLGLDAATCDCCPRWGSRWVRLPRPVCGDWRWADTVAEPGVYRASSNKHGALCVKATNGRDLGIKPREFQVLGSLDWLIVGGESGPKARPCDVAWIRSIVEQCRDAGVACFVKQLGQYVVDRRDESWFEWRSRGATRIDRGPEDGRVILRSRKGGDPSEWPEDLRVREFPVSQ